MFTKTARCYEFWMDYLKCLDESTGIRMGDKKADCVEYSEDYTECLHRTKEYFRAYQVDKERRKLAKEGQH